MKVPNLIMKKLYNHKKSWKQELKYKEIYTGGRLAWHDLNFLFHLFQKNQKICVAQKRLLNKSIIWRWLLFMINFFTYLAYDISTFIYVIVISNNWLQIHQKLDWKRRWKSKILVIFKSLFQNFFEIYFVPNKD